ncbi:MAG: antibiotic biosynthesis monooxygenase family protein [Sulfurifustis sp.]
MDSRFAKNLEPPYYAVIFTSRRTPGDNGYARTVERMSELAAQQPGYLGIESARDADGFGITVSYGESLEAIAAWRENAAHCVAKETGPSTWYEHYELRVAKVERAYARKPHTG